MLPDIGCHHSGRQPCEQVLHGSFWGNYTDISEVLALMAEGKIHHTLKVFGFDQINEQLDLLRTGDIVGRAVMKF